MLAPATTRPVRFLGLWSPPGAPAPAWRIKVYSIAHGRPLADPVLVEAAKLWAGRVLAAGHTRHAHYHAGFLGVHDGRGENQVFLDIWINENELLHRIAVSTKSDPARLAEPGADHNSVCVWDLALQWREREAWVQEVMSRGRPHGSIDAYLARVWEGEA